MLKRHHGQRARVFGDEVCENVGGTGAASSACL